MKRWLATVWRVLRELSGDSAYERYLAEHAGKCSHPPLTRQEFYAEREQRKWSRIERCC